MLLDDNPNPKQLHKHGEKIDTKNVARIPFILIEDNQICFKSDENSISFSFFIISNFQCPLEILNIFFFRCIYYLYVVSVFRFSWKSKFNLLLSNSISKSISMMQSRNRSSMTLGSYIPFNLYSYINFSYLMMMTNQMLKLYIVDWSTVGKLRIERENSFSGGDSDWNDYTWLLWKGLKKSWQNINW
jgi:hypothetical protein